MRFQFLLSKTVIYIISIFWSVAIAFLFYDIYERMFWLGLRNISYFVWLKSNLALLVGVVFIVVFILTAKLWYRFLNVPIDFFKRIIRRVLILALSLWVIIMGGIGVWLPYKELDTTHGFPAPVFRSGVLYIGEAQIEEFFRKACVTDGGRFISELKSTSFAMFYGGGSGACEYNNSFDPGGFVFNAIVWWLLIFYLVFILNLFLTRVDQYNRIGHAQEQ